MNNRELILQSIQIIETNLRSKISVLDISKDLGFSFYYYSRLFKSITGHSPKSYILARKITESARELMATDKRIIDIALDYGFGSAEAYSRAFFKMMHQNPSDMRREGAADRRLLLQPITEITLKKNEHVLDKEPEIVFLEDIKLVGISFYYDLSLKNDLSEQWSMLTENLETIPSLKKPLEFYQMQFWFPNQDTDSLFFYVAVAVSEMDRIPIQMTAKIIPAQIYYKFRHKGLANQVGHTYRYIYEEWLPATDKKLPGHFNFEYYGKENLGPYNENSISEIYIPAQNTPDI
ncbi:AraC family transcriptional regulator [Anoxynatronum buryatiense]|uniref:AraC family transcriptional regulator n=1 Tax=Anoxynatronum buryatiense TaxID=489973 RepID=A0AA45WXR7_9CLOT|nr:AraC family transcriptional regulator [Anoxynatronum buryatiense]SMP64005.1 AraC family transcriptional regulator [Anoxynatronum buryatiense]